MKKYFGFLMLFIFAQSICANVEAYWYENDVEVEGYWRRDGTYIEKHWRSAPDDTVTNNYDFYGNVNPYTGERGNNYYRDNPSSPYYGTFPQRKSYFDEETLPQRKSYFDGKRETLGTKPEPLGAGLGAGFGESSRRIYRNRIYRRDGTFNED